MTARPLAALALALALAAGAPADEPKLPDAKAFDKLVVDALRDVHNKGADLYNTARDYPGTYRMYQGALAAVRPLLAHRPAAQKLIDDGLAAADKEAAPDRRAFVLHETIEAVRKTLKAPAAAPKVEEKKKPDEPKKVVDEPKKKPDEPKKVEPPKKVIEEPKKKVEEKKPDEPKKKTEPKKVIEAPKTPVDETKKPDPKKVDETKPDPAVAPMPKGKGGEAAAGAVGGVVTLSGKPLAEGEVTFVSLAQPKPRAFTAAVKDGAFKLTGAVPAGAYAVMVTGKGVPEKYHLVGTSGLRVEVAAGAAVNVKLDAK